jgi:3-oxoacid CoA-transferase subunit A
LIDKTQTSIDEAIGRIASRSSVAVGGFGRSGVPVGLVDALLESGADDLHVICNNCGLDGWGLGRLLEAGRIAKVTMTYLGENKALARMFLNGDVEIELVPQGTLAEKLRCGGAGIPAFYTRTGAGTLVEHGGIPTRHDAHGQVVATQEPKPTAEFDGITYLLERSIVPDFALVHAAQADRFGNLRFRVTARNFNPVFATAGVVTLVEADEILESGRLDPDDVHLPGVYVDHVLPAVGEPPIAEKATVTDPARKGA